MSDLVGNPEDRFSRVEAHILRHKQVNSESHSVVDHVLGILS